MHALKLFRFTGTAYSFDFGYSLLKLYLCASIIIIHAYRI